jgi:hypothetical protein
MSRVRRCAAMAASSLIRSASYWPDRRELELMFWSGRRYLYSDVPADIADEFVEADSKGSFYNRRIRNCFPCRELADRSGIRARRRA